MGRRKGQPWSDDERALRGARAMLKRAQPMLKVNEAAYKADVITIDRCLVCSRKHRPGSTAAVHCANVFKKRMVGHSAPLILDDDLEQNEALGGTA